MARLFLYQIQGVLADLMRKLSGENGLDWLSRLKKFLRGEDHGVSWVQAHRIVYAMCGMGQEFDVAMKSLSFKRDDGTWRLLVIQGLTYEKIIDACRAIDFLVIDEEDDRSAKDIDLSKEARQTLESYVVSFAPSLDATEDFPGNPMTAAGKITLLERLLLSLVVWIYGEGILDLQSFTLCIGSCTNDGKMPIVFSLQEKESRFIRVRFFDRETIETRRYDYLKNRSPQ